MINAKKTNDSIEITENEIDFDVSDSITYKDFNLKFTLIYIFSLIFILLLVGYLGYFSYDFLTQMIDSASNEQERQALLGVKRALEAIFILNAIILIYLALSNTLNQSFNDYYFITSDSNFGKISAFGGNKTIKKYNVEDLKFKDDEIVIYGNYSDIRINFSNKEEVTSLQNFLYNI